MEPRKECFKQVFSLPFNYFENILDEKKQIVTMHWHDRLEIIHVLNGKGTISINLKEYPIQAGDIIAVMPEALHAVRGTNHAPLHSQTVIFSLEIPKVYHPVHFPVIIQSNMTGHSTIVETIDLILHLCKENRPDCESLLVHYLTALYHLFSYYGYQKDGEALVSAHSHELKKVLLYIEKHYDEKLTISQLAQICGYSKYYFCRFFSNAIGCSFTTYLQHFRIEKAKELLRNTTLPVSDISHMTGFSEASYFISVFRNLEQCSPLQYRNTFR